MSFTSGQLLIGEPSTQVDRTNLVWDQGQFTFSATRGDRGQCDLNLCILPGESYDPQIGWPVWVYDPPIGQPGSQCRFVGTIEDRDVGYIGDAGLRIWAISVLSLEQMYDTQPCPELEFPDGTDVATIVDTLFGTVTPPVSVTIGTIESGFTLDKRTYSNSTNVWAAIKQLAVDTNKIAYIDPRDQKFYFVGNGERTSGFTLLTEDLLQNGSTPLVHYKQQRADFRNVQITQANPNSLPPINAQLPVSGLTDTFTLPGLADQVLGATLTTSIAGIATGTFTGNPSPGDTVTIGGIEYTWQSVLDNTQPYEILIAGTANANAVNLAAAVNRSVGGGTAYSFPTVRNPYASIDTPSAGAFLIRATAMGLGGNDVALLESTSNFSWSTPTITGGSNALGIPLTVGVEGTGTFDLYYTPGSSTIRLAVIPGAGQILTVTFIGPGSSQTAAGNDSATSLGIGGQYQIMSPRNVTTQAGFQQQQAAVLAGFSVVPGQFEFQTYHPGCYPGDTLLVALTVPADLAARVNGDWLIQDVRGEWVEGFENLPDDSPDRHFRCTVQCINSVQFNNYQSTLQRLVDINPLTGLAVPQQPVTGSTDIQAFVYMEAIQISDTTVANDIAPHITLATPIISLSPLVYRSVQALRLQGVLKQTLSADLTVRINCTTFGSPMVTTSWEITFPSGWGVDDPIYVEISGQFSNGAILSADILAGPGTVVTAPNGVASVTLVWA